MSVIKTQSAMVSNSEALAHVSKIHKDYLKRETDLTTRVGYSKESGARLRNLHTAVTETIDHLTQQMNTSSRRVEDIPKFIQRFQKELPNLYLTKQEKLMLCNIRPRDTTCLDVCIEDMDARLNEEQKVKLIGIVKEVFDDERGIS